MLGLVGLVCAGGSYFFLNKKRVSDSDLKIRRLEDARKRLLEVKTKYSGESDQSYTTQNDVVIAIRDITELLGYKEAKNVGEEYSDEFSILLKRVKVKHYGDNGIQPTPKDLTDMLLNESYVKINNLKYENNKPGALQILFSKLEEISNKNNMD